MGSSVTQATDQTYKCSIYLIFLDIRQLISATTQHVSPFCLCRAVSSTFDGVDVSLLHSLDF